MTMPADRQGDAAHDEIRQFYDETYYSGEDAADRLPWHMRRIAGRLGRLAGVQVLDIACGTGQWLAELKRRGANVAGMDISARAVEQARLRLPSAEIRVGVAESLPFADNRFDIVTCLGSLEHFIDQPGALVEMTRVAKRDAHFLILVPNSGFLTRRFGLYGGTQQTAVRETVRSLAEWAGMLDHAGLAVQARWRDLHPLSWDWINRGPLVRRMLRLGQATALAMWPVRWQYQVYFLCRRKEAPVSMPAVTPTG